MLRNFNVNVRVHGGTLLWMKGHVASNCQKRTLVFGPLPPRSEASSSSCQSNRHPAAHSRTARGIAEFNLKSTPLQTGHA